MSQLKTFVHPQTKKQAAYFLKKPASPLLILGPAGSGKLALALYLAAELLGLRPEKLTKFPYFIHVQKPPGKQDISIDTIRQIIRLMRLKVPGRQPIKRLVLIENAQHLNIEAQNAFLKLLEEPSDDTVFILTATHRLNLLPTVASRCRQIQVHPAAMDQASDFYRQTYPIKKIENAWRLSQGQASLMAAVLSNEQEHPLKQEVEAAKSFLKKSKYERLLWLDKTIKDREGGRSFLEALAMVLGALHHSSITRENHKLSAKLLEDRGWLQAAIIDVDNNANLRLLWLHLVLRLSI